MNQVTAYLGLGSNLAGTLDSPAAQVEQALKELSGLPHSELISFSPFYGSRAVGPTQPDYVNAAACLQTSLAPLELLDQLQTLEQTHQRVRREHWGPRTLDLDLLLYGNEIINLPRLQVPHPYLQQRNFVLYPLAAIAPDLVLPCGTALASLLHNCPTDGLSRLAEP